MTKFDRETLATTGFLKERGVKPVLFGPAEGVILGLADVVMLGLTEVEVIMVLFGLAEVVMIIKTLDMMLAVCIRRVFVKR